MDKASTIVLSLAIAGVVGLSGCSDQQAHDDWALEAKYGRAPGGIARGETTTPSPSGDGIATGWGPVGKSELEDADLVVELPQASDFGRARFAGDVDGDGLEDLLVSSSNPTRVHLIYGSRTLHGRHVLGADDAVFVDVKPESAWRLSMAAAGDVDGDGYGDFLLGAQGPRPEAEGDESGAPGRAYLVYGRAARFSGEVPVAEVAAQFRQGDSLRGGGAPLSVADINGDGFDDLFIGNTRWAGDEVEHDAIHLFYGGEQRYEGVTPMNESDAVLEHDSVWSAPQVMGAGDVDGDGIEDVLVGLVLTRHSGIVEYENGTRLCAVAGASSSMSGVIDVRDEAAGVLSSPDLDARLPHRHGDFNGDGRADIAALVGERLSVTFGGLGGTEGRQQLSSVTDFRMDIGAESPSQADLAVNGDINGDGFDDVVVSARIPAYADSHEPGTHATIIYGRAAGNDSRRYDADAELLGPRHAERPYDALAVDVGHFNGDRYADIALYSQIERKLYLVFGGP